MNDPDAIAKLQAASAENSSDLYRQFSALNTKLSQQVHLRGLLRFKSTAQVRVHACARVCIYVCPHEYRNALMHVWHHTWQSLFMLHACMVCAYSV